MLPVGEDPVAERGVSLRVVRRGVPVQEALWSEGKAPVTGVRPVLPVREDPLRLGVLVQEAS